MQKAQLRDPLRMMSVRIEEDVIFAAKVEAIRLRVPLNQYVNDVLKAAAPKGKRK